MQYANIMPHCSIVGADFGAVPLQCDGEQFTRIRGSVSHVRTSHSQTRARAIMIRNIYVRARLSTGTARALAGGLGGVECRVDAQSKPPAAHVGVKCLLRAAK